MSSEEHLQVWKGRVHPKEEGGEVGGEEEDGVEVLADQQMGSKQVDKVRE